MFKLTQEKKTVKIIFKVIFESKNLTCVFFPKIYTCRYICIMSLALIKQWGGELYVLTKEVKETEEFMKLKITCQKATILSFHR